MIVVAVVLLALILIALVFGGDAVAGLLGPACGGLVLLGVLVFVGFAVFA